MIKMRMNYNNLIFAANRFHYPLQMKHDPRLIKGNRKYVHQMPFAATQTFESMFSDIELYNK